MYMNRNEAEVTLGRSEEFEAMIDEWSKVQGQNAGFVGATLLQSYANPGRYTLFSRWVDRDASIAAGRREPFKAFAQKLVGSGLLRPTRLTEAYESVFDVDRADAAGSPENAERWVDFTLAAPMATPTFEAYIRELAQLSIEKAPGVFSVRLRRSVGNDTKYLMIVFAKDRAAARGWLLVPEIQQFTQAHTNAQILSGSPSAEIHHVVKRYAGPALAQAAPAEAAAVRPT
jgi:heme-degrading monooxygenase HmoA